MMDGIKTGRGRPGALGERLRWAALGAWRIVAYAEGGYTQQLYIAGVGWCLPPADVDMPKEIERPLCEALGIPCGLDAADEAWTVADILAREG